METTEWLARLSAALGEPLPDDLDELLDLTRDVAHAVERKAVPLTVWVVASAVAHGTDRAEALQRVRDLLGSSA